jgi:multidrug efflux pump subunit AcrB
MFFLAGVARYLFVPLAEAVVFAMLASYVLSRTLVPTLAMYLLKPHDHHAAPSRNPFARFQRLFETGFERVRSGYSLLLERVVARRQVFIPVFMGCFSLALLLIPLLGQNFFPSTDNGSFILHVRARTGTRIEETARLCDEVEDRIRATIPPAQMDTILDNIGLPYSPMNTQHATSGLFGAGDADIMVSLQQDHRPTADFVRTLRDTLPREFPGATFYFLPSDIVTQILNFGLPAPIDVQIDGSDNAGNRKVADRILQQLRQVPGLVDARLQQPDDYPVLNLNVDRTKAQNGGYTERDVGSSVLNILSGSSQLTPMFFLNSRNGVNYPVVAESPQYRIQSLQDLENIPMTAPGASRPEILADVATFSRSSEQPIISHYNIRRTVDVYANVQDRDLGAVARDVQRIVDQNRASLARGNFIAMRGQVETMRSSYTGLLFGLVFSILLVYLLIVVNFQSWLDPFIIITALPAAICGIVLLLFFTHTTLSVPALMGAIMCMGVATANSILVVSFAKDRLEATGDAIRSAIEAGATRFRPVLMTALAMIIGMIPMALGLGEGGEQNAPLGRAVIGGLILATIATLIFVPAVFALLHGWNTRHPPASPSEPQPAPRETHALA